MSSSRPAPEREIYMKVQTRTAHKELEHETARMAACLCAAIDAVKQAEAYAEKKYPAVSSSRHPDDFGGTCTPPVAGPSLRFAADNVSSIGLSLYIRRRDEAKKEYRSSSEGGRGGQNL